MNETRITRRPAITLDSLAAAIINYMITSDDNARANLIELDDNDNTDLDHAAHMIIRDLRDCDSPCFQIFITSTDDFTTISRLINTDDMHAMITTALRDLI